jgi:hypothetical protein
LNHPTLGRHRKEAKREEYEHQENRSAHRLNGGLCENHTVSITPLSGHSLDVDMDATVRTLVVISLFAALCAVTAIVLDQGFLAAIFAAESAFALVGAIQRSR